MKYKLLPLCLLCGMAIYLFFFPQFLSSKRLEHTQTIYLAKIEQLVELKRQDVARVKEFISHRLSTNERKTMKSDFETFQNHFEEHAGYLSMAKTSSAIHSTLSTAQGFLRFKQFMVGYKPFEFRIPKVKVNSVLKTSVEYYRKVVEYEMLKMQQHYFSQVLDHLPEDAEKAGLKVFANFDKESYRVGDLVSVDLKYLSIRSLDLISSEVLRVNEEVIKPEFVKTNCLRYRPRGFLDSISVELKFKNPITQKIERIHKTKLFNSL